MKSLYKRPIDSNNSNTILKDVLPKENSENRNNLPDYKVDLNSDGLKNVWTGTKSSLTYLKRHNQHHIPNFHKEFSSEQFSKLKSVIENSFEELIETVYRRNIDGGPSGANRSAVPHGLMQKVISEKKPYKPSNGKVSTWIDEMPDRKKNQGLTYLQKKSTLERKIELEKQTKPDE